LVCTGLASRGIDFLDVSHVIQYEMATNAVEFMHRIGRTARAGRGGTATSLYDDARQALVEVIVLLYYVFLFSLVLF
jgi:superfamily II DNA/RNA helicase